MVVETGLLLRAAHPHLHRVLAPVRLRLLALQFGQFLEQGLVLQQQVKY